MCSHKHTCLHLLTQTHTHPCTHQTLSSNTETITQCITHSLTHSLTCTHLTLQSNRDALSQDSLWFMYNSKHSYKILFISLAISMLKFLSEQSQTKCKLINISCHLQSSYLPTEKVLPIFITFQ